MSSSTEVVFYCFQPLSLDEDLMVSMYASGFDTKVIKSELSKELNHPAWLKSFNKFSDSFNHMVVDSDVNANANILNEEQSVLLPEKVKECLNQVKTKSYLMLDSRFMYFMLVYEIHLDIPATEIDTLLLTQYEGIDFYNLIRNLIIKENDDTQISTWAIQIRKKAVEKARQLINKFCQVKANQSDVLITHNSGNITCLVHASKMSLAQAKKSRKSLLTLNQAAERVKVEEDPVGIVNGGFYSFNGRFHTVFIRDSCDVYRYIPIQFHAQYLWHFLKKINAILEKRSTFLSNNINTKDLVLLNNILDKLINLVEVLTMHNESFKLSIELDNEKIYDIVQRKWNLDNMLRHSNQYINFFKEYLSRAFDAKVSKVESKQNSLLLFISVLQLIAIVSVWNDYLSLISETTILNAQKSLSWIMGVNTLKNLNLTLPIILLVIVVLLLVYVRRNNE